MEEVDRMTIQKNWTFILDSLKTEDVIPYLIQKFILDSDMVEEIEAAETRKQKARRLMTRLMQRGPTAYQAFRKSLLEYNVYEHLVQRLDSTNIDPATLPVSSQNRSQSSEQPDLGITQLEEDPPSQPATLQSFQTQSTSVQQPPDQPPRQPSQQLPQPPPPSLPGLGGGSNFRIAGNNNFVIMGSNNTQVYYH